jgi:hypothetical protein
MNGVVYTASPAAQEHFPSGSFQMKIFSALRTMDVCFFHGAFSLITLPQPLPSREGRSTGDLPSRRGEVLAISHQGGEKYKLCEEAHFEAPRVNLQATIPSIKS